MMELAATSIMLGIIDAIVNFKHLHTKRHTIRAKLSFPT